MKIDSLMVVDLHGYITGELILSSGLNILYGKNGSGKTTALNLIRIVLNFEFQMLRQLKFKEIKLCYSDEDGVGEVLIKKGQDGEETISIDHGNDFDIKKLELIDIDRKENQRFFISIFEKAVGSKTGKEWAGIKDAIERIKDIRSRANITLVNIDRTMHVTSGDGEVAVDGGVNKKDAIPLQKQGVGKDPLEVVQNYCSNSYIGFINENNLIKNRFINELMMSFLNLPKINDIKSEIGIDFSELDQLEEKFKKLGLFDGSASEGVLKTFFSNTRDILTKDKDGGKVDVVKPKGRKTKEAELDELIRKMSLSRVSGLLTSINEMEISIEKARSVVDKYLYSVNSFFGATGKEIEFSAKDNRLYFRIVREKDNVLRNLIELSSGERQIIIVLTYLYFVAKENSIFIVDEPELSLHLAWQKKFVDQMKELAPKNCQIILASHSPEIVGAHRSVVRKVFSDIIGYKK